MERKSPFDMEAALSLAPYLDRSPASRAHKNRAGTSMPDDRGREQHGHKPVHPESGAGDTPSA